MTRSSAPPRSDDFQIEIDPGLIEEALAAVSRHQGAHAAHPPKEDTPPASDDGGVEVDLEIGETPQVDPAVLAAEREQARLQQDEMRRLQLRIREQADRVRRLEAELARVNETRMGLDQRVRDLRAENSDLSAEFERYRTRARKDAEEAERRGEDRALRPIVDVYDNVERAWLHAVSDPSQILGGLQIIVEQFKRLLGRLGFERIDADRGTLFDPAWHEAVLHVPNDELLPGVIVDEVHAGFKLRGRLFRAARVTVSAPIAPL